VFLAYIAHRHGEAFAAFTAEYLSRSPEDRASYEVHFIRVFGPVYFVAWRFWRLDMNELSGGHHPTIPPCHNRLAGGELGNLKWITEILGACHHRGVMKRSR
jgi:hypothetical protein